MSGKGRMVGESVGAGRGVGTLGEGEPRVMGVVGARSSSKRFTLSSARESSSTQTTLPYGSESASPQIHNGYMQHVGTPNAYFPLQSELVTQAAAFDSD